MRGKIMVFILACLLLSAIAAQAAPELSASSISVVNGEPWLLYGAGLKEPGLQVLLDSLTPAAGWDAAVSLKRLQDGKVKLPFLPPKTAVATGFYKADDYTAAVKPWAGQKGARAAVIWARGKSGVSAPLAVNRPEVWTIFPRKPFPGDKLRLFGPNMGSIICLVSEDGRVRKLAWSMDYSHEKGSSPYYERSAFIPADTVPGAYRLYVNGGGGDYGWSGPTAVEVRAVVPIGGTIRVQAPGEGEADATGPIQAAIDQAAAAGGGVVFLGSGIYRISAPLQVKPGVTLRGSGRDATLLTTARGATLAYVFRDDMRPIVVMQKESTVEDLGVDATPGRELLGILLNHASGSTLRNCRVVNLDTTDRPEGKWRSANGAAMSIGYAEDIVLFNNEFYGFQPFSHIHFSNGRIIGGYIACNTFRGLPVHSISVAINGMKRSVFEHNLVENGGRGLVFQIEAEHNYFGYNTFRNIKGINNGCEMFLYEMGGGAWWGHPGAVGPRGFDVPGAGWKPDDLVGSWAVVSAGKGMGQLIRVVGNSTDSLALERPWRLAPDGNSQLMLLKSPALQNLHIENRYQGGVTYHGPYGSALRNIWAGDEYEDVASQGFVLWAISGTYQMSLNLVRDQRMNGRGSIQILTGRFAEEKDMVKSFGNEIRSCQVYERVNYPGNEYGLGTAWWRYSGGADIGPGNARFVSFGHEAAIHLTQTLEWEGRANDDDPRLDGLPPATRWNLIWDSLTARSPIGVRVARGVENTIIIDLFSALNGKAVSNSGRGTLLWNPMVKQEDR